MGDGEARRIRLRLFERVQAVPYATDGAHTAAELVAFGRGDCLAKSAYLVDGFRALGCPARRVWWLYRLPPHPPEVRLLVSREDVHSAAEVLIGGRWTSWMPPTIRASPGPGSRSRTGTTPQWTPPWPTRPPGRCGDPGTGRSPCRTGA
ncbi:transglutaminase domain-containing protein [Streptomyces jumonjinensis]|uniref:Transglutaminase-like domain-containing protein n=1 Tax=Streptomyces jumonjinensis TaxID=1945 RepID=A0A646KC42_STRJU|nr:transglutaminase domain-containing protein [Streptomyces jumonjinensis]MQS99699.1 hypothetical protein [Streptomyces jumonjinensis]